MFFQLFRLKTLAKKCRLLNLAKRHHQVLVPISVKAPSDGESLAQSILKMEMNLSKEIKENLAKNFDDMFDRMDHQEEAIEKIRLQFIQLNARFEKFEKENLNKRINGLVTSGALKTNSYVPAVNSTASNGRTRAPFSANMVRPQQSNHQSQQLHHRIATFVSNSDDEQISKVVSDSPVSAKLSDCVTTAMGSVSKEHCQFCACISDSKSEPQLKEGAYLNR
uniref:Uncharacterized protein n=1 Tax=Ditylenchus dipsaci TaxID=166011 RepID=A0A915DYM9_9BILA